MDFNEMKIPLLEKVAKDYEKLYKSYEKLYEGKADDFSTLYSLVEIAYRILEDAIDLGTNPKYSEDSEGDDYLTDGEALDMIIDRLSSIKRFVDRYTSDNDNDFPNPDSTLIMDSGVGVPPPHPVAKLLTLICPWRGNPFPFWPKPFIVSDIFVSLFDIRVKYV